MQERDDFIRETIKITNFVFGCTTVVISDILNIKFMSKKDIFTKRDIVENGEPSIFYGEISRKYDCFVEEETTKINSEAYNRADKINKGQILVNLEDFDYENIGRCILYQNDISAAINGNVAILTLKEKFEDAVNLKYITFYLNYKDIVREYIYNRAVGEKVKRLSRLDFEHIPIAIPLIEVQDKIIDNFTEVRKKYENNFELLEKTIELVNKYVSFGVDGLLKLK
ncbi:restriction endonuclease subunit S [Fusobacterium phage FNU_1P]|nr:restriction endonuclease subunit S [Fusobacterium phage FNU_1P]